MTDGELDRKTYLGNRLCDDTDCPRHMPSQFWTPLRITAVREPGDHQEHNHCHEPHTYDYQTSSSLHWLGHSKAQTLSFMQPKLAGMETLRKPRCLVLCYEVSGLVGLVTFLPASQMTIATTTTTTTLLAASSLSTTALPIL